jgi:hypothetical protein
LHHTKEEGPVDRPLPWLLLKTAPATQRLEFEEPFELEFEDPFEEEFEDPLDEEFEELFELELELEFEELLEASCSRSSVTVTFPASGAATRA